MRYVLGDVVGGRARALVSGMLLASVVGSALAEDFTAGTVVTTMDPDHRFPFVLGIIEGISYDRYIRDGKKIDGMKCIYEWGLKADNVVKIYDAFAAFPEYAPAAVVTAMAEKECGK
jgi:hypothetical protein